MKSPMLFLQYVLKDLGTWCHTSTDRDLKTITARVEDEGLSFLTITLANFGGDLQKALDQGFVGSDQFYGFRRSGGLPRFLSGFLRRVFDEQSGLLLDSPDEVSIWAIRQLTLMFAKINLACTEARKAQALSGYIQTEQEIRNAESSVPSDLVARFRRIGVLLWADYLSAVDLQVHRGDIVPRHGSGQTADRLVGNAKWNQKSWTRRLDRIFPVGEYLVPNLRYYPDLGSTDLLEPRDELPVRVVLVPKTQKTPRVIAMEPTCMQYMQQGVFLALTQELETHDKVNKLIGWLDQSPNQQLAQSSSLTGSLATLDLSEASDRVSNQHVRLLLANHPWLAMAVDACRSRKADVPGYGVQRLAKFASMGSALTFPMESMVFMTIVFTAIELESSRPMTQKRINSLLGRVRCYGDDIIVPVEYVETTIRLLETFGLKVNRNKTFSNGKFRESCGGDYYNGHDVSIVRCRELLPSRRSDVRELESTVSFRNQLYYAGMWETVRWLDNYLEGLIPFPTVAETSRIMGRQSFLGYETQRMHPTLHSPLVKGIVRRDVIPENGIDGVAALMKCLTTNRGLPTVDVRHLERSGRPRSVGTKARWAQPF